MDENNTIGVQTKRNMNFFIKLTKVCVFITIFCCIWYCCFSVLWMDKNTIHYFYEEPKKSLDCVYVGASNAYWHFNTTLAYNLYGFTTGMLSHDSQPFVSIEYLIRESEKYQKPQLYIVDITKVISDFYSLEGEVARMTTDAMKFSVNRINAINSLIPYTKNGQKNYLQYYFSFLMYHNRWKGITENLFKKDKFLYKGYYFKEDFCKQTHYNKYAWTNDIIELPDENKQKLKQLIDYIKSQNLNVLFVIPVRIFDKSEQNKLNNAINIIQENGLNVINFNTVDDLNIDFSTEFFNNAHLNVYGATKYTLYFSKYIKQHYDLQDHRGDSLYTSWENEYERFKQDFKEMTNKNFDDVLLDEQGNAN